MMDLPVAAYKGRPADINTNILSDFHDFLRPAEQMTGQQCSAPVWSDVCCSTAGRVTGECCS